LIRSEEVRRRRRKGRRRRERVEGNALFGTKRGIESLTLL
jgi:hypothetical protein